MNIRLHYYCRHTCDVQLVQGGGGNFLYWAKLKLLNLLWLQYKPCYHLRDSVNLTNEEIKPCKIRSHIKASVLDWCELIPSCVRRIYNSSVIKCSLSQQYILKRDGKCNAWLPGNGMHWILFAYCTTRIQIGYSACSWFYCWEKILKKFQ